MSQDRHGDRVTPLTPSAARRSARARGSRDSDTGSGYRARFASASSRRVSAVDANGALALPTVEEVSAGGMVVREVEGRHQVAIIARYNRGGRLEWVLPKGHPEGQEEHHEAAVREVEEETGIAGTVLTTLGSIDYWFTVPSHRVHKTVHHYLLRATGGELTIENDPDQEAVDVAWVELDRLASRLTFLNERRIVEAARELMHEFFDTPRLTVRRSYTTRRITGLAQQIQPGERPVPTILRTVRRVPKPSDLSADRSTQPTPTPAPSAGRVPSPADLARLTQRGQASRPTGSTGSSGASDSTQRPTTTNDDGARQAPATDPAPTPRPKPGPPKPGPHLGRNTP